MTKAEKIAAALNAHQTDNYKNVAQAMADRIKAGLYWLGTGSTYTGRPWANVWQVGTRGQWSRQLGTVRLCADNVWRA